MDETSIQHLIGQAFHEIYDQAMPEDSLNELFKPDESETFKLHDLDYWTERVGPHIEEFLTTLKNSFANPFTYNSEFDWFCHDETESENTSAKSEDNQCYSWNTPLVEINNLFQKFSFIINLYKIKKHEQQQDAQIGKKRKRSKKGMPITPKMLNFFIEASLKYDNFPFDAVKTLIPRLLGLFCQHLRAMHSKEEIEQILEYVHQSWHSWNTMGKIISNAKTLLSSELPREVCETNFQVLIRFSKIMESIKVLKQELDKKQYKTTRDNVQVAILEIFHAVSGLKVYFSNIVLRILRHWDKEVGAKYSVQHPK